MADYAWECLKASSILEALICSNIEEIKIINFVYFDYSWEKYACIDRHNAPVTKKKLLFLTTWHIRTCNSSLIAFASSTLKENVALVSTSLIADRPLAGTVDGKTFTVHIYDTSDSKYINL